MAIEGHRDYRRREFCRDVACPVQTKLEKLQEGSEMYERVREECKRACKHTAREFHYWLMKRGFLIVKPDTPLGTSQGGG